MAEGKPPYSAAGGGNEEPAARKPQGSRPPLGVIGDFDLQAEIGRGGMGIVYRAWQRSLKRTVALKVLGQHVSASPTAVLRFQREAQAAARLHHTHIVPIFAQGEDDGVYYYAMELIEGCGLNAIISDDRDRQTATTDIIDPAETILLNRQGTGDAVSSDTDSNSLPQDTSAGSRVGSGVSLKTDTGVRMTEEHFRQVAQHMADVADALDYAHQQGIIHRDIKPHNLILGDDGRMRVADFGLARLSEQPGVTVTGEMIGSPLYMSPEQIRGGPEGVDHRTDIYSLGATMYEWITLTPPYPGETREQVISTILTSEPQPVRALNPAVPVDLETICAKAIEKDANQRYRTAAELRNDLRRFLDNRPIKARRASIPARTVKFLARHQLASLGVAAVLVAVSLGYALFTSRGEVQAQRAAAEVAQQETDKVLDLVSLVPPEVALTWRATEAAGSVISDVVREVGAIGTGSPAGIALRAVSDFYDSLAEVDGTGPDSPLLVRAMERWEADPTIAAELIAVHVEQSPEDFDAHHRLTALWGRLGTFDKMADSAARLIELRPNDAIAFLWHGLSQLLQNNPEASLSDFARAVELGGPPSWCATFRGLALAMADRTIESTSSFDDALLADPELIVALIGRAGARASLGNYLGAVDDLSAVLDLEPDNSDAITFRGDHYVKLSDFPAAEKDYERAMILTKSSPTVVMRYLYALSQLRGAQAPGGTSPAPAPSDDAKIDSTPPKAETENTNQGAAIGWLSKGLRLVSLPRSAIR